LSWAQQAHGHQGMVALARLRLEQQNLLAIHERATAEETPAWASPDHALLVALATEPLYEAQGPRQEQVGLLDEALALAGQRGDPLRRARALAARGRARRRMGQVGESRTDFAEALRLARAVGDVRGEGRVLRGLGVLARSGERRGGVRREA